TWMVVADARDPRSVERMIVQASERLDGSQPVVTPDGISLIAGTDQSPPRAWRVVGNRVIVACGNQAESLVAGEHTHSLADAFLPLDEAGGNVSTPLALYSGGLLEQFGLSVFGIFAVEDGSMVMRGSVAPPPSVGTSVKEAA